MSPKQRTAKATVGHTRYTSKQLRRTGAPRTFQGRQLAQVAFPLGGIGTGTISLGGRGNLQDWEIFNRPAKGKPVHALFALWAQAERGPAVVRVLQGPPLPPYTGSHGFRREGGTGLPPMRDVVFTGTYPFARVDFSDDDVPLEVTLEAFSPFIPLNETDSSLPVAILTYRLTNPGKAPVTATVLGALPNLVGTDGRDLSPRALGGNVNEFVYGDGYAGFKMLSQRVSGADARAGTMALAAAGPLFTYRGAWARGAWWDDYQRFWDEFSREGMLDDTEQPEPSADGTTDMASLGVRLTVAPGETASVPLVIAWHFPHRVNDWNTQPELFGQSLTNYYATCFNDAWHVAWYVFGNLARLEDETRRFTDALFGSDLPAPVLDAVSSQASIMRTNTCLRLHDGRFFGFEGCSPEGGCCPLNCTHVWNYEQAVAYLFPGLERTMRETDLLDNTDESGFMAFRTYVPLGTVKPDVGPAADGQMGTILKLYREWQLSGDRPFLERLWPRAKRALEYALVRWDEDGDGVMERDQHNTYDIEFYGPNTMMGTLYLGALRAGEEMAVAVGDEEAARRYRALSDSGSAQIDETLWNGEYYVQSYEGTQGHKYQYGPGCLSDQLLGQWFAEVVGLGHLLEAGRVRSALRSIFRHNFRTSFYDHPNCQRLYAVADEAGLLLCSWPKGGRPELPVVYGDEVWTGIEYQVAAHLIYEGLVDEGLAIVKAVRDRHDGERRNPWNEFECGDHYARAMSSWSLLLALSGYRYSAPAATLSFAPRLGKKRFRCLFTTGSGWGVFDQRAAGQAMTLGLEVLYGHIALHRFGATMPNGKARPSSVAARLDDMPLGAELVEEEGRFLAQLTEPVVIGHGHRLWVRLTG